MESIALKLSRAYEILASMDSAEAEEALGYVAEALEMVEGDHDSFDGQPDEAQEWYDFDPDC
mgnify:FL=1